MTKQTHCGTTIMREINELSRREGNILMSWGEEDRCK